MYILAYMLLFKLCLDVNPQVLTFLEVGFGGNLVEGFRVYALKAVPSFPQIAQCALEMQSDPSPKGGAWFRNLGILV